MTVTVPSGPSFFVAGTMQGARRGRELLDQSYRDVCASMILDRHPGATVIDPARAMWTSIKADRADVREAHAALAAMPAQHEETMAPPILALRDVFHEMLDVAARCDVCVAVLPDHEPSMGTAAEMLSAYRAGRTVITVTDMRQNLAVLACSTCILPDLDAFGTWLDSRTTSASALPLTR